MPTYILELTATICGLLERNLNALWDVNGLVKLLLERGYSTVPSTMNDLRRDQPGLKE